MTPAYFDVLMRRHERNVERDEYGRNLMLAQLTAMVANTGFARFQEPRTWQEFMPFKPEPQKRKRWPSSRTLNDKLAAGLFGLMNR